MKQEHLSEAQAAIWASYQRMRVRLAGRLQRELTRKSTLSEADFEILSALKELPDASGRAIALRCGLEWEKSRLSHQLRRMEQRGLITRGGCEEDSRSSVIQITEHGQKLHKEASLIYEQTIQKYVTNVLTEKQLATLGSIAETILKQLEEPHHS